MEGARVTSGARWAKGINNLVKLKRISYIVLNHSIFTFERELRFENSRRKCEIRCLKDHPKERLDENLLTSLLDEPEAASLRTENVTYISDKDFSKRFLKSLLVGE